MDVRPPDAWILIRPLGALFFGGGRSFTAGEGHRASSVFPPSPMTVQGAVRAHIASRLLSGRPLAELRRPEAGGDVARVRSLVGDGETLGALRFTGPFLTQAEGRRIELRLPAPLAGRAARASLRLAPFGPAGDTSAVSDLRNSDRPPSTEGVSVGSEEDGEADREREPHEYVAAAQLRQLLLGRSAQLLCLGPGSDPAAFEQEERTGIRLEEGGRVAARGFFYRIKLVRPARGTGLAVGMWWDSEARLPEIGGVVRLGGEGHLAELDVDASGTVARAWDALVTGEAAELRDSMTQKRSFLLYLAQPGVFHGGWRPDRNDLGDLAGSIEVVGGVVEKPQVVTGWDLARGRPRGLLRAAPAGSVYHCEVAPGIDPDGIITRLHARPAPTQFASHAHMGFGLAFMGVN